MFGALGRRVARAWNNASKRPREMDDYDDAAARRDADRQRNHRRDAALPSRPAEEAAAASPGHSSWDSPTASAHRRSAANSGAATPALVVRQASLWDSGADASAHSVVVPRSLFASPSATRSRAVRVASPARSAASPAPTELVDDDVVELAVAPRVDSAAAFRPRQERERLSAAFTRQHRAQLQPARSAAEAAAADRRIYEELTAAGDRDAAAVLAVYRLVLADGVRHNVAARATGHLRRLAHLVAAVVKDFVGGLALAACPPPEGAIRAIATAKPFPVPLLFDAADRAAFDGLARRGAGATVVKTADYSITVGHLRTLEGTSWVNDMVINYYATLVQDLCGGPDEVMALGSFFYTKLAAPGGAEAAARWTNTLDVFRPRKVLMVINSGAHWTLAVLNNARERLEYYDSLGGRGDAVLDAMQDFFDAEYHEKAALMALQADVARGAVDAAALPRKKVKRMKARCAAPLPARPVALWARHAPGRAGVPQQANGFDCGVFTMQFCLYAALDHGLGAVSQANMPFLRSLTQLEVLQGKIMRRL
jgi:hypothetical protein